MPGRQNGGGLLLSATSGSLSLRSAATARILLCARLCRRRGIITLRRSPASGSGGSPGHNRPVDRHSVGNNRALPGSVVYVCPVGLVQITFPSGSWQSRQPSEPVQNVFRRW